jgi:coproporphyrinogen III oxidase-like Fe-S oxidoreductase
MISDYIRNRLSRKFTGQREIKFQNIIPKDNLIAENIRELNQIGLYLHIPFCNQICPYCPYNKEIFHKDTVQKYIKAVIKEVNFYAGLMAGKPVSSFYIGGGTPTTMLGNGIEDIINSIYKKFNIQCSIHMESHPNHLSQENLDAIESLGVKYLSIGVEAMQDKHLKVLERPYTVKDVKNSIERAVSKKFECVNIDYIFDLPGQTYSEVEKATHDMVRLGIHQAATYPLFRFKHTRFGREFTHNRKAIGTMFRRRKFLKIIEDIFYNSGFERSSVWAFTRKGIDKYCSVTVPSYLGLGASGSSYLSNIFYVNTFNVGEYIKAMENGNSSVALSVNLSGKAQMAGWLYWRIYETKFRKSDFQNRFKRNFDKEFGNYMRMLEHLGFLHDEHDQISLTDRGTYWIHAFEDFFSIDYINKLWKISKTNPWPENIVL